MDISVTPHVAYHLYMIFLGYYIIYSTTYNIEDILDYGIYRLRSIFKAKE